MHIPFRDFHTLRFLNQWWPSELATASRALDKALYLYFRENKSLGSKDRESIAQQVYYCVRWKITLDSLLSHDNKSWQKRLELVHQHALDNLGSLPHYAQVSMPKTLYEQMEKDLGAQEALRVGKILQETAPVCLRVNRLKTTRDELLSQLPSNWQARAGQFSDSIFLGQRVSVFQSQWFEQGLFEMQDEGSQVLADCVQAKPGDWVLDYCAGSGGKSLAFAPKLAGKGQIFLHDVRLHALTEARKRLKRAGIQNAQLLNPEHPQLKRLRHSCDWVLVDAPCTGTGTLRRNPDMKERLTPDYIQDLVHLQRQIFAKALTYLKPSGKIIYATCSLLNAENEDQIESFMALYPLQLNSPVVKLLPTSNAHDGFFCATFTLRK